MGDRRSQPSISVMLGVEEIPFWSALPLIHVWADVLGKRKQIARVHPADLLAIDSNGIVVSGRPKQISLLFACRVDIRSRVADKGSIKRGDLDGQCVRMSVRAAPASA